MIRPTPTSEFLKGYRQRLAERKERFEQTTSSQFAPLIQTLQETTQTHLYTLDRFKERIFRLRVDRPRIEEIQASQRNLKRLLHALEKGLAHIKWSQLDLAASRELRGKIAIVVGMRGRIENSLAALDQALFQIRRNQATIQRRADEISERIRQSEQKARGLRSLQPEINSLQADLQAIQSETSFLQAEATSFHASGRSLDQRSRSLANSCREMEGTLSGMEEALAEIERQMDEAEEEMNDLIGPAAIIGCIAILALGSCAAAPAAFAPAAGETGLTFLGANVKFNIFLASGAGGAAALLGSSEKPSSEASADKEPLFPEGNPFHLAPYRIPLEKRIDSWKDRAWKLPDESRRNCTQAIWKEAEKASLHLIRLKMGGASNDTLRGAAKQRAVELDAALSPICQMTALEKQAVAQRHNRQISHHHSPHHRSNPFIDLTIGATAHQVGHRLGKGAERTVEITGGAIAKEAPEKSQNPWRDRVVSSGAHLVILEAISLALPRIPSYAIVGAAHIAADVANAVEPSIQEWLNTHDPEDFVDDIPPDGGPNSYQAALATRAILQGARKPHEGIEKLHHWLTEKGSKILHRMGITDESVVKAVIWLMKQPEMLPLFSPSIYHEPKESSLDSR